MKPFEVSRTDPSDETLFPLSAAQRATWFAQQFDPEVPILIAHYVELRGELDVELLDRETRAVAYEFQSPLLKVIEIDGQPMQYVDEKAEISVGLVDLRGSPDPIEDALGWMRRDCRTQLDLAVDGIVATAVLRVGDAHYLWYSRIHHVALDGFGAMTMMNRIAHRYSASAARKDSQPSRAATLRTLYDIDERYRMSDRFAADREYWAERNTTLAGSSLAEASGPAQTESRLESTLMSDRSCALLYESENHAAPVIAALALYVARMTAKETVQIHVPMSGRTTAVLRDSGGMMVNVTPLLIRVAAVDTVGELFAQVQHELMGALRHQRCSLDDIRRDAGVTSGLEGEDSYAGPMVNVMLFRQEVQLGEVVGEYHIVTSGPVDDLLVNVYPSGDRLRVDFRANPIRYEEAGLREHHRNFVGLLEELIASDSGAELADIHSPTARECERRQREVRHLEYWRHELTGAPELLQLPFDRPRPATQSLENGRVEVLIAADTHARITAMASDLGTDTRAVLHASFALLVSRLSGASDVVIGTPAGSDANIVAIRSRIDLETPFTALLGSVVEVRSNALPHSGIRLEQVAESLEVEDVPAYAPVIQVTFESVAGADEHPPDLGRFDLGVSAVETFDEVGTPSGITVTLAFATDLFDAETVRGLGLRFARVLESVTTDPTMMVGDIDILSDDERSAMQPVRSDPRASHRTLAELFDGAARTHPDGVALSYLDAELTYRELDERSSKLARVLIDRGIGPENSVALGLTRSIESVVAMLAVTKAGAAFVPVDPTYPGERVRFMLTDSGAVLGLTVVSELHRLPDSISWIAIDDAEFRGRLARLSVRSISDVDRVHPIRPDNPAYVIYTSGSTGLPKGVTVSHRGLEALAAEQRSRFGATQDARTLHFSTPSFDASIFEYLLAFGAGATMVIAPSTIYGGDELSHFLESQRVTHGFVTTAALGTVSPEGLSDFGDVVVGGEACPPDLVQRWAPGRRLCNAYGPTETTVMSNIGEPMVSSEYITVGGPLRGFDEIVLDQRLHPVPDGVVGELYISGDALARGYHRKYALTAGRFVADPFGLPGRRMYRTGDLVRRRRGRELEYVGRSDFQVKVRGFRIELGEIDSVVQSCPQVENAVTVARAAPSGTTMITTYVVPAGGSALSTADLTQYAASRVPSYMVPAAFVLLDELPVTPSGKVDRAALPAPRFDARSDNFRPPEGAEELLLAEIFADVLGVETVGAGDDFFELGGNSLIATKLIALVNAAEAIDFGVRTLFEAPTIESLALHVRDAKSSGVDPLRSKRPILQAHSYRDKIPVSLAQQRLWFVNQFDTSSPAYNIPMVVRLSGALDVAALKLAMGDVVDRHESLRTVYPASVDGPHQVVVPSERVTSEMAWEVSVDEEALDRRVADLAREGFDVSANVPVRGSLFRITPDVHVLALVVHHISADGASLEPLARDLTRAYAARAAGRAPDWPPLPVQYADYSQWQIELLGSDADPDTLQAKQLDYWTSTLSGLPDVIDLPLDRPRPAERSMRGESVRFSVPADVHSELLELARNHNTTPFMVMHAVLAVLLARLSASPDIAIGTPVGGRAEQVLDDLVGMFVNTVVLRITVDTAATFEEILSRTREVDLAAFGQAEVPFERVVDAVAPERSSSRSPLFQVLLEFQNTANPHLELPGLGVDVVPVDVGVAKFDLQLSLSEQRGKDGVAMGFDAAFTYASDIFERTTVAEFGERFVRLLRSAVSDPTVPVGDTEILGAPERGLVVGGWDGVGVVVGGLTLVDVLDGRFAGVGGGGLVCGGVVLSWGEFDVRVNRFARFLISLGVGPESRVCVALSRSVELLVAVFAVVRAGGVFVPVDVGAPVERVGFVVGVVDPVVVLSRVGDGGCLPVGVGFVDVGCVDVSGFSGGPVGMGDRLGVLLPEHAVYVMFTSGSTGRPKGVVVSHAGVVNRLLWMQGEFPLGVGDVVLQKTPVSFDVSVWELFWPLMVGARLVVADPGGHRDPVYLVGVIERWGVSVVHFVPSMLEVFVGELSVGELGVGCSGLRRVFVSGEGLSSVLAGRFAGVCGAELVNLYGPTEASVDVTFHVVEGVVGVGVPIGRPVWNTRVLVLDSRLRPVPVGVVGELYVGGVQVARGYEGRVDLTVGRFVADPVSGVVGARVYRTGDVVRWGCGGVLEFVGRKDFQVKVRGQRVELGEVEAVLAAQVGVAGAVVVLRSGVGGDFLVGFVVGEVGVVVDEVVVLEGARRSLPGFMVPSVVVVLGEFPVTVHGKLDRKALPDVNFEPQALQYVAPRTPIEETVAAIFDDLLGTSTVGVNDDFFALGGNSLSAARLVARVNSVLGERINIRDVFDASTVAALAELAQCRGGEGAKPALTPRGMTTDIPLSPAQERMWFANQFAPESAAYNVACALRLDGPVNVSALHAAFVDVVERHESLRTVFPLTDNGPRQVIMSTSQVVSDLVPILVQGEEELRERSRQIASVGFDVTQQVPMRATVLRRDDQVHSHVLVIVIHHIAADGFSTVPLARDLMSAYSSRVNGEAPQWAPLGIQYADYALWQRGWLGSESDSRSLISKQLGYWAENLAGAPEVLDIPTDRPRVDVRSLRRGRIRFVFGPKVHAGVVALSRKRNATVFMVVHAALAVLLARLSDEDDVAVGTPIAGRGERELDDLVGMFVNTLVLRTAVDRGATFGDFLDQVRNVDLSAFIHADVPFERVVEIVNPSRSTAYSPLFQVMLEFQDIERPALELPDLQVTDVGVEIDTINFDLQLTVTQNAGAADESDGLRAEFGYATDIFDEETVAGFADRLQRILERVITDPQSRIGDIEILDAYESAELVPVRGEISAAVRTLPDLLTAATDMATARDPGAVALVFEEREVTYLELDAQSNRLARMLIESGVGPESVVALCLPRSIESVLAVWSIAKTGAAFLPVDPGHPAARIEHMLGDSGAGWGITSRAHNAALSGLVPWLVLDDAGFEERLRAYSPSKVTDADRKAPIRIDNPVYLIYTSGSTGTPKGVTVTHRGLSDFALQERETFAATTRSRTLHFSSPSFDASVLELVMAVGAGATMVIVPPTVYGGSELAALLERERVTHCFVTPAALTSVDPDGLTTVGCVVTGGEACPPELVARWAPGRKMFNAYGPTEATVVSSISAALAPNDPVTIGTPTRGFSEVVLDSRLRAVPVGVAGELYLAGPALARGYHRRYPLTATQFVADPFGAPGTRIYRTGDRVRWTPDRRLEYLGRTDAQVKVRGFRIELGEVEVALQTHPRVAQAVTAVWNGDGRDRLIGYVVPDRGASVDPRDVLAHAGKRLPSYMVPAAVVVLDAVPLTVHGKLDRAALPTPDFSSAATPDRPPRTETENLLAALFAQVLGLDSVGVHDSFFELGGDSIMSIQLVARARDAGVIISPRDVFDHKSVAALAESAHLEQDRPEVLAELPGSAVGTVPLSPVAQWMLDRSSGGLRGGGVKRFSQALLLTAPADLTQDLLVRGLQVLLDRHGMLRARLVESDRVMEVLPPGSISAEGLIHRVAVDSVDDERFRALASGELEAAADSLDPAAADMVRVIWFDLADKPDVSTRRGRLLVVIHHLVVDGVSWRILVTDLASVTAQLQAGVTPELPQIGTSFRRWAHGLVEHVGDRSVELDMWITILDGDDPLIGSRPLDPTIDVDDTVDTVTVDISPSATRNLLTTVPAAFHAGVNDGLVTAVALASIGWRRRRGMDTVAALITLEGHGREEGVVPGADLARTVGWFTTLYPVRVDLGAIDVDDALAGGADAGRALKAVKEYVRAIPDHGIGFGMLRYLSGESDPLGRFRSPQISFNYLGRISSSDGTQDWLPVEGNRRLGGTQNPSMPVASVIDINAAVEDHVDGPCLTASFTFPRGVLDRSDIAEFAELWRRALDGLIAHASRPDAGGLTPSDIPLVSVDQQQIERWENDFPGLHDVWSVSPLQAGLMFHASLAATSTDVYTAQLCVELEGAVDSERLRGAGAGLLANHPNLCAAFVYDVNGLPVQLIVDDAVIPWTEVDLSDRGSATDADLERRLDEDRSAPFDLASPPLLRLTLLRTSPTRCVLVVTNHHIVLDGWSIPLLVRELLMRYAADGLPVERAPADLPETPSYRAYLEWLMHRDMETSLAAWEDALEGVDEPTLLAPSTPIAEQLVPEEVGVDLPDSVRDGLGALVQRSGITMNTVIQAAWGVLLSRMLSRDDVVFGVTVSGRSPELSGVENMMGLLINTLPVRVQLDPDETCTQLLARLQSEQTALLDHHYVGLGAIQSVVGTGNLFDTLSVFESYPIDTSGMGGNTDIAGMRVTAVNARDATHYPLTVLSVAEPTLQVSLRYQPAAFDRAAVDTIAQRMSRILAAFAANADTPVGEVDVFVAGERGLVVGGWDGVGVVVGGLTLVDVLDGRFAGVGGGGLVCGGVVLSWGEFDVRVNRFARFLISLGVGPESRVCVALSRSVELLVAVFAVVRAGGVFVPVDVGAPVERVGFVVGVVDPVVVLSRVGDGGCLPVGVGFVDVGCVDVSGFSGGPVGMGDRLGVLLPEHAVYVMFTSGSTGRPKGVVVSHAGVVNRLLWMQGEFPLGVGDVVLQKTPVSFDVSVWELFWPLMVGARLVVADPGGHRDPVYLVGVIERWGVSVVHFVPSMLEVFVGELSVGELGVGCSGLRRVFVSGEGLSSVLAGRFAGVCGAELVNLYGPTEASVDVTFHVVEGVVGVGVPIGRPVWNTRVLVLDSRLRPVPVGVVGELYVGGVQVARGYEGRVDLTVGRFVADPVSGVVGARVYRTGDVVRWGCGGVLEFVGRTDFQVKVRGQRVELGEVEAVLAAQVGVAGAVVVLRSGVGGDFLVGFVVGEVGVVVDEVVVLEGARRSLPGFMVPSVVVVLGEFPVTVHGKLDRKALPDTDFASAAFRIPATPAEIGIARAVADVLGLDQVGADDSFFELGGDSLSATRVIARINAALHTNMGVNALFDGPVVADLAASIDPIDSAPGEPGPEEATRVHITSRARPERIPLSFAQSRMWFVNQFETSSPLYNIPVALQLDGFLDSGALQAALGDVVERHESLRTIFPASADGPYQVIAEPAVAAPRIHPVPIPGEGLFTDLHAFFDIGFDVSEEFPLHVRLLRTGPEQHVLAIVVHHIAADGFSMAPLARDLMSAYTARTQGRSPDWAPLPVQYADYTLWQREIVDADVGPETSPSAEFDYWTAKLSGIPDVLPLPLDRPRTSKRSAEGAVVSMDFSPEIHRALNELAHQNGSSLFMVMHAALAVLLARLTTADDVVIGTPVAGRGASVFDDVVGMFVNTLVLRTPVASGATFAEVLAAVRSTDLGALDHADIPFERLVDYLSPDRSTEHSPLFQVLLEFQTDTGLRFDLPELTVRSLDVDLAVAKFDLQLSVMEHVDEHGEPAGISAGFRYATDIFDRMSVARIAARFERVIGAVTENQSVVVGDIDMILAVELSGLLVAPTPSGAGTDEDSLSDLFDRTALTSGAAVAVRCGGLSVTYRELDERANRLARLLVAQGVGPETLVAVAMARSIDLMVALLAVVKAGGGYVPVDSTSPVNRVDFVLRDARPKCVLTTRADGDYIRDSDAIADSEIPVIAVDDPVILDALHRFSPLAVTDRDRLLPLRPESVAYVIYTSGSTGRPKGVQVSHRSVVTLLANTRALFGFGSGDVWTMFHSEAFDFSVWEMWGALAHGGRLVLVDYFTARSPEAFLELLRHERVTVLNQTPTAFYQLAEADRLTGGAALSLRYVIFGGEALDFGQLTRWYARRGTSSPDLVNMYGITETTVHVSHLPLDRVLVRQRSASVIGRALPGLRVYVLDQRLHPVPPGVVGELYVSGDQVSRGYLGRFGLTSARFIPDLAVSGARMYRSGDLGRWNDSGQLEYLGRNDLQVQVKGYRIELGEVEAALLSGVGVSQSAVVARRDRLVGYVVPESGATISPAALLEYVSQRLAPHMVPAVVTVLEGLPLTVNGKLDRNALPEPDFGRQATVSRGPASATENILASLFAEVLGLEEVGVDDSFFTLGGDSIMSIQLVTRARSAGVLITPREVFERKTVAALSETAGTAGNRAVVDELPGGGVGEIELTPIVEWMLDRGGDFRRYSQSVLLSVPATLDQVTLTLAMQAVLDHHDILRAGIRATHHPESARRMDVAPVGTVRAETVVRHVSLGGSAAETVSTELDAALGRLDPEAGVMVQAVLLDTDGQIQKDRQSRKRLLLVAHHLVTDGVSWRILIPDLALACAQVQSGVDPSLAPVGTSMRRWAHGLVDAAREPDRVAEIDYWREVLEGPDPTLGVRALTKRDTASATIDIEVRVPTGLTEAVSTTVPQAIHGSVEDGLLTALALAMVRWRMDRGIDNPETLISLEGHGREEQVVPGADLARTVGWFTTIFPVRIDLSGVDPVDAFAGGPAAGVAAKTVKEQLRAVPDRGIGFGLLRYLNRETAHTLSQLPVPQISFNYLGRVGGTDADASAGWVPIRDEDLRTVAAVDLPLASVLEVNVMTVDSDTEDGPQLVAGWTFPPDILGADDVRQLGQWWLDALAGLAEFAAGGGGFTPSDFDLVDLRQEAIDDLESRCPDLSDVWPLSPLQAGLLFHAELAERSVRRIPRTSGSRSGRRSRFGAPAPRRRRAARPA